MSAPYINYDGDKLFFDTPKEEALFKSRYPIRYCYLCDTWTAWYPDCKGSNCNCKDCGKCHKDLGELDERLHIRHYLRPDEQETYDRIRQLKKFIGKCLARNQVGIDWKLIHEEGWAAPVDYDMFPELKVLENTPTKL